MSPEIWIAAAIGFFVGGFLGVWMMCIFAAGGRDDQTRGR